jgi:GNAT superfamily N-acetyltransferase
MTTADTAPRLEAIDPADDAALGRWVAIYNEIDPRPVTIDGWRAERTIAIEHLELVATLDGDDVGVAECGWGSVSGESKTAFLGAWVLPAARRRGVGTALVDRCVAFARKHGMTSGRSGALEGDDAAIRFAARYGLEVKGAAQIGRLDLTPAHAAATVTAPVGVRIVTFAERPDLERAIYDLDVLVQPEIPTLALEPTASFEAWQAQTSGDTGFLPELSVIALRDGQVVGAIQMYDNGDRVAFIGMTAVHPNHRRAGIARALKTEVAARAARAGWRQLETFNDGTNERMRALNLALGYIYLPRMVNLKGPLAALPEG